MIRDVLRTIGFGCILAGAIVYFTTDSKEPVNAEVPQLQDEMSKLKSELAKTKEELAIAQTASSTEKPTKKTVPEVAETTDDEEVDRTKPILIIEDGSNSTFVATSLESLGIIQDAAAFDTYLTDNDLSGKIQIGEHHLDSSMDFETIAKKITSRK